MKKELSALDLHFITKELQVLINAKVEQIYQIDRGELFFQFHVPSKGKHLLRVVLGKLIYLASSKSGIPEKPPGFCLFLRKRLKNARLRSVTQLGFERILEFVFETKDQKYKLIIESFSTGNVILCDEHNIIFSPLERQEWKDRSLRPKAEYAPPTKDIDAITISEDKFVDVIRTSQKESIVKSLAIEFSLGGMYSEAICLRAGVDKNLPTIQLSDSEILTVYKELKSIINSEGDPKVIFRAKSDELSVENKSIEELSTEESSIKESSNNELNIEENVLDVIPFSLFKYQEYQFKAFTSFSEALDFVFTSKAEHEELKHTQSKGQTKLDKINRMIAEQEHRIKGLEVSSLDNQKKGEFIYENYPIIEQVLKQIKEKRKDTSWKEIKEALKNHKIIKSIDEKTGDIVLEL